MPSDVTGTDMIQDDPVTGQRRAVVPAGPIFANVVLADEINRTPPKTQAALLEAMQEKRVTVQGKTYQLEPPFFVFATQNPIELEGTYPLPEAQLDRFMFEVVMEYSPEEDEVGIVRATTTVPADAIVPVVTSRGDSRLPARGAARAGGGCGGALCGASWCGARARGDGSAGFRPPVARVRRERSRGAGTHPGRQGARTAQGRTHVTFDDIRALARPVLRHRLLRNFQAQSERVTTDQIIDRLLEAVPMPKSGL